MENQPTKGDSASRYWRINLIVICSLLTVWAVVAYGCSILFVEQLNQYNLFELPLGFWFANQGSMYVFVALILIYAVTMDIVDRRFHARADHGNAKYDGNAKTQSETERPQ